MSPKEQERRSRRKKKSESLSSEQLINSKHVSVIKRRLGATGTHEQARWMRSRVWFCWEHRSNGRNLNLCTPGHMPQRKAYTTATQIFFFSLSLCLHTNTNPSWRSSERVFKVCRRAQRKGKQKLGGGWIKIKIVM